MKTITFFDHLKAGAHHYFWCALLGANVGAFLGELMLEMRWPIVLLHFVGAVASYYMQRVTAESARIRIAALYDERAKG